MDADADGPQPIDTTAAELPDQLLGSLCLGCESKRLITSGSGAVFLLCGHGLRVKSFPKYPPQPVGRCDFFSRASET